MFSNVLKILLYISLLLSLSSCSFQSYKPLKISASTWIGYTPLFYAKEKGMLDKINVDLVNIATLNENVYLYKAGSVDLFVGTQYEYQFAKEYVNSVTPIMLLDESYGGDMILSNSSLKELKESKEKIDAYLEMDSVNFTVLDSFLKYNGINEAQINYINQDPLSVQSMKMEDLKTRSLVVTYAPFDTLLKQRGLQVVASTKDEESIVVVDGIYASKKVLSEHYEQLQKLKEIVNESIDALHEDPKEYYRVIKPYMLDMSFDDFQSSLENIKWIHQEIPSNIQDILFKNSFPLDNLL